MRYGIGCDRRRKPGRLVLRYALFVGLAAVAGVLSLVPAALARELFVTNFDGHSITVYNSTDNGNTPPLRTLIGAATQLNQPRGMLIVNGELFVTNEGSDSITVYTRTASGDTAPLRTLSGAATGLNGPRSLILDPTTDELLVANYDDDSITVHNRTASGNTPPLRTLIGAATGLNGPKDLALGPPTVVIPMLSEWALIGMAALFVGLLAIRRTRHLSTINRHR